ncbi:MAG: DUF3263 domain-containing protein [Microbacterium sp.]|nr:DUF3263 domain-containing protein [Microbacterium sp.]
MDAQPAPATAPISSLTERDLAILDFEHHQWLHAGQKHQAIRERFGISAARYYQLLGALIDSPAALAEDPLLVTRLQRIRDGRIASRAARRAGDAGPASAANERSGLG